MAILRRGERLDRRVHRIVPRAAYRAGGFRYAGTSFRYVTCSSSCCFLFSFFFLLYLVRSAVNTIKVARFIPGSESVEY